jgi:agmatine/peptidylarginine deiminase
MITDKETNFLYISIQSRSGFSAFEQKFCEKMLEHSIKLDYLKGAKDIWCRDFMPVQVKENKYVLFQLSPLYYPEKDSGMRTDSLSVCRTIGIEPIVTDIFLDGGNVVKGKHKAIMTDRIIKENKINFPENILLAKLKSLLELDELIIIRADPDDYCGHADGMVRLLDDNTVLVNDYTEDLVSKSFLASFSHTLSKAGLKQLKIPYNPDLRKSRDWVQPASGCYINYFRIGDKVFVPFFGNPEQDKKALTCFKEIFTGPVIPIFTTEIATYGGVLNCMTWNILK